MEIAALFSLDSALALLTLTALEIVLGIDNIVFIAILTERLPEEQQHRTRVIGLTLALVMRILLLFSIFWVMQLTTPLFTLPILTELVNEGVRVERIPLSISGRDLILLGGGLFLIGKATYEIHQLMEGSHQGQASQRTTASPGLVLIQIALLDAVFSLDSVVTAVGMARQIEVMVAAVVIAIVVMIVCVGSVSRFVMTHPSIKTLALSFLVMIGILLIADGLGQHLPRGYIYFAMVFSLLVEFINLRIGARRKNPKLS